MGLALFALALLGLALGGLLGFAALLFKVPQGDPLVEEVRALMPGVHCGQCGFPGCVPAAEAVVARSAPVTCCPPGGRELAEQLARLLGLSLSEVGAETAPVVATVDEARCTGCTRCFRVCPTDAILGANRQLHAVIKDACTGCAVCAGACPEACIELAPEASTLARWHWPKPVVAG